MQTIQDRGTLTREDRSFTFTPSVSEDAEGWRTFEGVASSVDKAYNVRDQFGEFSETIAKGAFHRTIAQRDRVDLLYNHNRDFMLANTKNGSLVLEANPDLEVRARLNPADADVQKVTVKMDDGRLDEMSIGFRVLAQEWNSDYSERLITEVRLYDVSVVNEGASPFTGATLRAVDDLMSAITADTYDEPELRRLIAHLGTLLPQEEREEDPVMHPDLVAASYEALRRLASRPAA